MQAAKSGMTGVCKLYIEHGAEVDVCTVVSGAVVICGGGGLGSHWKECEGSKMKKLERVFINGYDTMVKQLLILKVIF